MANGTMTSELASSPGYLRTQCAICGDGQDQILYPANFDARDLTPGIFSARRMPDRTHFRIVRCERCGLVRSDPVADPTTLAQLYAASTFDYGQEVVNLRHTYGRYLSLAKDVRPDAHDLLEVGCGNGFFLEEALAQGFTRVAGVEPSSAAIDAANPRVAASIVCDIMRPGLFEPESFDIVCLFQVFDHIPDPGSLLDECHRVLRPGGLVLCLNHDVEALSARLLRERSPIIDIEHTYLYDQRTLGTIFDRHGFRGVRSGAVTNTYSPAYLAHLLPLPRPAKRALIRLLGSNPLRRVRVSVRLGNLYLIATKPGRGAPATSLPA